jgi:hypothetical protein
MVALANESYSFSTEWCTKARTVAEGLLTHEPLARGMLGYLNLRDNVDLELALEHLRQGTKLAKDKSERICYLRLQIEALRAMARDEEADSIEADTCALLGVDYQAMRQECIKLRESGDLNTSAQLRILSNNLATFESWFAARAERYDSTISKRQTPAHVDSFRYLELNPAAIPLRFRDLLGLAQVYGIGDESARGEFLTSTSQAELEKFRAAFSAETAKDLHAWLDTFEGDLSPEAACFMYCLLALEDCSSLS